MNIETKLSHIKNLLSFADFPNKQELCDSYENLKGLFNSPPTSLIEAIESLKGNLFYKQFKLDGDPQFINSIVEQIDDIDSLETLLDMSTEIKYSQIEKKVLNQRLKILILLSILNDDLKEATEFEKIENKNAQNIFFEVYIEDFKKLRAVLALEEVTPQHIDWFLHSDLFAFISRASDCFNTDLKDIYQVLIEKANITMRKYFVEHRKVLIEKYNVAAQERDPFQFRDFLSVLNAEKNKLKHIKRRSNYSNQNSFFRLEALKAAALSPVAREALINNLKKYKEPINERSFKR